MVYVYARRIMGWRVSRSMQTDFVLYALEQALYDRQPVANTFTHHSDRGSPYVCIRYTERRVDSPPGALEDQRVSGADHP